MADQFNDLLKQLQETVRDQKDGSADRIKMLLEQLSVFVGTEPQKAYLINISDQKYFVSRSYRDYWVMPAKSRTEFSVTEIDSVTDRMDYGLGNEMISMPSGPPRFVVKTIPVPFSAMRVAEDVARQINGDLGEGAFVGVFVSLTRNPTPEKLAEMTAKYVEYQQRLVFSADQKWTLKPDHRFIADAEKRAAIYLKIDKPWCYAPEMMSECPACFTKVSPSAIKCGACGAILNIEKCIEMGIPIPRETMKLWESRQKQTAEA
jgi:hypothetical protein